MSELKLKNYICIDGKKVELTEEQLKVLGIELKKVNPFERVDNEMYYTITSSGKLHSTMDINHDVDRDRYNVANYCTDENLMQQRALHETLDRLLWRFSMENGGDEIDWNDQNQCKYFMQYSYWNDKLEIGSTCGIKEQGREHFISREIVQRAIDEIVKPFMAEHPEFVW